MAVDMFLKLDGIKGESSDDKHKGEIEILSYSWGVSQHSTAGKASAGGGRTTQRADISDFTITKTMDAASAKLFEHCATGQHIKEVTLALHRAGGDKQQYAEYKLSDVIVSSYSPGASSGGDVPMENVSFNFSKIEMKYTQVDPKTGKATGNVSSGWDLLKNSKI
jgi:type VI secretion system secreted protein Hcp